MFIGQINAVTGLKTIFSKLFRKEMINEKLNARYNDTDFKI
jgi:hypothetical protein